MFATIIPRILLWLAREKKREKRKTGRKNSYPRGESVCCCCCCSGRPPEREEEKEEGVGEKEEVDPPANGSSGVFSNPKAGSVSEGIGVELPKKSSPV